SLLGARPRSSSKRFCSLFHIARLPQYVHLANGHVQTSPSSFASVPARSTACRKRRLPLRKSSQHYHADIAGSPAFCPLPRWQGRRGSRRCTPRRTKPRPTDLAARCPVCHLAQNTLNEPVIEITRRSQSVTLLVASKGIARSWTEFAVNKVRVECQRL